MRSLHTTTEEQPLLTATREDPMQQQRPITAKNKLKKKLTPLNIGTAGKEGHIVS